MEHLAKTLAGGMPQGCDKWQSGGGDPPCFEIKVGRFGKKLAGLGEKLAGLGKKLVG